MTGVEQEVSEVVQSTGRRSRRVWIMWTVLTVGVLLVVAGLVGWTMAAAQARADVSATYAAPLACKNTTYHERWEGVGQRHRIPIIDLTRTLQCTARFRIANHGSIAVRINSLTLPVLGRNTGGSLRVFGPHETYTLDGRDAVFHVDRTLPSHSSMVVAYQIRFWPRGCTSSDVETWAWEVPYLSVTALGRAGEQDGNAGYGWRGSSISEQGAQCQ